MGRKLSKKQLQAQAIMAEYGLPTATGTRAQQMSPVLTMDTNEVELYRKTAADLTKIRGEGDSNGLLRGAVAIAFLRGVRTLHTDCPKSKDLIEGFKNAGDADPKNSAESIRLFNDASMKWLIPDSVLERMGVVTSRRMRTVLSKVLHKNRHEKFPDIVARFNRPVSMGGFSSATHFAETLVNLDGDKQKELVADIIGEAELTELPYTDAILALPSFETEYKRIESKQGVRVEPESGEYHHLIKMAVLFQGWADRLTALVDEADSIPSGTDVARTVSPERFEASMIPAGSM